MAALPTDLHLYSEAAGLVQHAQWCLWAIRSLRVSRLANGQDSESNISPTSADGRMIRPGAWGNRVLRSAPSDYCALSGQWMAGRLGA